MKYYKVDDVINAIEDKIAEYIPTLYGRYAEIPLELRVALERLPTIEPIEENGIFKGIKPTGEWKEHKYAEEYDGLIQSNFECSQCHDWSRERTNYCPKCGAKMRLE